MKILALILALNVQYPSQIVIFAKLIQNVINVSMHFSSIMHKRLVLQIAIKIQIHIQISIVILKNVCCAMNLCRIVQLVQVKLCAKLAKLISI